ERVEGGHELRWTAPRAPGIRRAADEADSVLRAAPHRAARADGLGAGAIHLRREHRGRAAEASARLVLHQEPVSGPRPVHHGGNHQDRGPPARRVKNKTSMHLTCIVGARPNFPKMAPIIEAARRAGVESTLIHTGQHYDAALSDSFFLELDLPRP